MSRAGAGRTGNKPITQQRSEWRHVGKDQIVPGQGLSDTYIRRVGDGKLLACVTEYDLVGWHMSISHEFHHRNGKRRDPVGRYPTWDEIADARNEHLPADLAFVMHLPAAVHDTTFHIHQAPPDLQPNQSP